MGQKITFATLKVIAKNEIADRSLSRILTRDFKNKFQ